MDLLIENIIGRVVRETVSRLKRSLNEAFSSNRLRDWFSQHGGVMKKLPFDVGNRDDRVEQSSLSDISDDDIVYFREFDSSENKDLFDRWNENSNNALNERWKMIHTQKQRGSRSEWDMKALFKVYSANDGAVILVGIDRNNFEIGSHWGGEDIKRISDRKWRNSFSHRKNSTRYDDDSDTYYYGKRLNDFGIRTNHDLNGKQKDNNELRNRMGKKEWNGDPWEEYQNKRKKHIDDYSRRHYGKGIHQ